MAKKSVVHRQAKRLRLVQKYAAKRAALRTKMLDMKAGEDERMEARRRLEALPRDANPCRLHSRCRVTGRPRGYYRKFGLGRNKLREAAMRGDIPGLVKASW
ncbi:MAG: 30S ribosomal protein S14 [Gammaproteobacteria bacterium]|nr:MAG: 30S ribosomal protein S14 [Gammaproteobacteria bacterium]